MARNSASRNGGQDGGGNFILTNGSSRNTVSHSTAIGGFAGFWIDGDRNQLRDNHVIDPGVEGFTASQTSDRGVYTANSVMGSGQHAFRMAGIDNTFTGNIVNDNADSGLIMGGARNTLIDNIVNDNGGTGFIDWSEQGANTYTDNTCIGNETGSDPEGLCSTTPPVDSPADDSLPVAGR